MGDSMKCNICDKEVDKINTCSGCDKKVCNEHFMDGQLCEWCYDYEQLYFGDFMFDCER